jgi:hypothetical protein
MCRCSEKDGKQTKSGIYFTSKINVRNRENGRKEQRNYVFQENASFSVNGCDFHSGLIHG